MGICDSKKNDKNESNSNIVEKNQQKIENSDISHSDNCNTNKHKLNISQISENKKENEYGKNSNAPPQLVKYERSLAKKSEISYLVQNGSEFSSKISEEEVIIKGEINKECQNKEMDFNNNSFMRLVKNKGGIVIEEDARTNRKSENNNLKNNFINEIGKDNISEIKSQISFQTNTISKNSVVSLINGKKNKADKQSELSKKKFSTHSMYTQKFDYNKSLRNDKKSYYSYKTNRPKINFNKYLNGIFNTDNEMIHNNYQYRSFNTLNLHQQYSSNTELFNKNKHNIHNNEKVSLISNNNKSNESTSDDLLGSFISIPKNDERIPEYDLNFGEDIISNLSSGQ